MLMAFLTTHSLSGDGGCPIIHNWNKQMLLEAATLRASTLILNGSETGIWHLGVGR